MRLWSKPFTCAQLDPEHVRVRDQVIIPLLKRDDVGKPIILSVDFEAAVKEPLRWKELLVGAVAGAALAFLMRRK